MARIPELIGATVGAIPGTAMARNMVSGAPAARALVLNALYRMRLDSLTDRSLDFGPRRIPFNPFDNQNGERKLLQLSGSLPEQTLFIAMCLGFGLNLLSMYGYKRSDRNSLTSNVPILGHLRPLVEIASSLSLAITPQILLMMIEQYEYLHTATHLGTTEAVMTFIPALLMLPAVLKLPSIAEGTFYLLNDTARLITGAVRGIGGNKIRRERQGKLTARQEKEKRNNDLKLRTSRSFHGRFAHVQLERKNLADIIKSNPIGQEADLSKQPPPPPPVDLDLPPFLTGDKSPSKKILGTEAGLPKFLVHSKT